ncbi:hypothetical protein [Pseudomonas sp. HLT2-19-2]
MMSLVEAAGLAEADCSPVDEFDKEALRIINYRQTVDGAPSVTQMAEDVAVIRF